MGEGGLDGLSHLQYINFLSLIDKESVIVSEPCYHCPYIEDEGRVSVLTIFSNFMVHWRSWNWQNVWGRENIFGVDGWDGCTQKEGGEKMILWTRKGEIVKWNLNEEK